MKTHESRDRAALLLAVLLLVSCGGDTMHRGRMPFSLLEATPRAEMRSKVAVKGEARGLVAVATHDGGDVPESTLEAVEVGDVVGFYMSHGEALGELSKGNIQKIPYELFQYGHVALVVPDPEGSGEKRLLQVAMKQAVNTDEDLGYLDEKRWRLFRPPAGSVDAGRLEEFSRIACERGCDPKRAYDYPAVFGWKNSPWRPESEDEVGGRFSCATLVVAALHYAGIELDAVHRGGRLDLVTPRQVVASRGWER